MRARGKGTGCRAAALCLAAAAMFGAADAAPARADVPPDLDAKVEAAMRKAVDFLLKKKRKDNWEYGQKQDGSAGWFDNNKSFACGETGLVLYALLHAGETLEDPRLKANSPELAPVVKWLCEQKPDTTYGAGFRANALAMCAYLKTPEVRKALLADQKTLMDGMRPDGGFSYSLADIRYYVKEAQTQPWMAKADFAWDNSNAQYAALAMWSINEGLGETPMQFWRTADAYWRMRQQKDGGWWYDAKWRPKSTPQMNLAGLATLYVTGDFVGFKRRDPAFASAWAAIEKDFKPERDDYYYMYGLERVGLATGMKFIGTTDWYPEVAKNMIKKQEPAGSWHYWEGETAAGGSDVVATSYALAFLARGRNPVVFNKLCYGPMTGDSTWDTSPRDNANVTHWMAKTFERPLNWQVVKLQTEPEQWLDAPILLVSGARDPKFSAEDIEKIRRFIYAGGIVLSYADTGDRGFSQAITKTIAPEVMEKKYEMRELPKDHPIVAGGLFGKLSQPPRMQIMSNGPRVVWFHSDADLGAVWHNKRKAQVDSWTLAANLYLYAAGHKSIRNKLQGLVVAPSPEPAARQIQLARLDHPGNADPEPGAWPRMAKIAQAKFHTDLQITTKRATDLKDFGGQVVHMTGTTRFTLSPDQVDALKAFLARGGTLIADASGGSQEFTASFVALTKDLAPDAPLTPVPMDDRIYTGAVPEGEKITEISYRRGSPTAAGTRPRLKGCPTKDGRWAILFSEEDITSGLLGTDTWGIAGYTPASAQALARNMLLYAVSGPVKQAKAD